MVLRAGSSEFIAEIEPRGRFDRNHCLVDSCSREVCQINLHIKQLLPTTTTRIDNGKPSQKESDSQRPDYQVDHVRKGMFGDNTVRRHAHKVREVKGALQNICEY